MSIFVHYYMAENLLLVRLIYKYFMQFIFAKAKLKFLV